MATSDIICVTNKSICEKNGVLFFGQIKKVAEARPLAIVLREKELSLEGYRELAGKVSKMCREVEGSRLIIHNFYELILEDETDLANELSYLHMPLWKLEELYNNQPDEYARLREKLVGLGASCHSVEDAKLAEKLGCTYIIAGHIYNTDCKKGLEGRGLGFLRDVVEAVSIPVYAIGGITPENINDVRNNGASGACIMSSSMTCKSPKDLIMSFNK
ncbi:MAG: thiamine phosphate synthase [Eubacterium sp.]|nr:thiamine phosphate synthase [Eubacterium sp.]